MLAADQAQKHVTHNEALLRLDALGGYLRILSRQHTAPPAAVDGDMYLLTGAGSGAWAGFVANDLALKSGGAWMRIAPAAGMAGLIADEYDRQVFWTGATWRVTTRLVLTPGGTGQTTIWRLDAARTGIPRQATISSVSGDKITLTAAVADQFFANASMQNVSYVRIWNASKSPEQPAWIRARGTTSELHVLDAAQIAGWTNGETIRIGDGTHGHPNAAAVDISQMLQSRLGAVFRQAGLALTMTGSTSGGAGNVAAAAVGGGAAFTSIYIPNDGSLSQTSGLVGSIELSTISNANLVFVREAASGPGSLMVGGVTVVGVYV